MNDPKVIVALDFSSDSAAMQLVNKLSPELCRLKVGKELFTRSGPNFVKELVATGFDVFLELKYHDIPNTVAKACESAAELGVWMVNVHSMGGQEMMEAARNVLSDDDSPLLIAVTLLTSSGEKELNALGIEQTPADFVKRLAAMAKASGLDGVVCSAQESAMLKQHCGENFTLVTPGIRPANAAVDDQNRIMTPEQAVKNGSDYLVIGRPVTQADDPVQVLNTINSQI